MAEVAPARIAGMEAFARQLFGEGSGAEPRNGRDVGARQSGGVQRLQSGLHTQNARRACGRQARMHNAMGRALKPIFQTRAGEVHIEGEMAGGGGFAHRPEGGVRRTRRALGALRHNHEISFGEGGACGRLAGCEATTQFARSFAQQIRQGDGVNEGVGLVVRRPVHLRSANAHPAQGSAGGLDGAVQLVVGEPGAGLEGMLHHMGRRGRIGWRIQDLDICADAGSLEQGREIDAGGIDAKADDLHELASPVAVFLSMILSGRAIKGSAAWGPTKLFPRACHGGHSPVL